MSWQGVKVLNKEYIKTALSLGRRHNNGFADSYLAATAKNHGFIVATFDEEHFIKLNAVLHEIE